MIIDQQMISQKIDTGPGLVFKGSDSALIAKRRRGWELGLPSYVEGKGTNSPLIIAVGGGKGGVGKSLVSANLAVRLAAAGLKVVTVDLDIGGANLHTYFGIASPKYFLADAMIYGKMSLSEVMVNTPVKGVRLIAGGREEVWGGPAALTDKVLGQVFDGFFRARSEADADVLVLDLGAGTHRHTLDFFAAANLGLVTVLPEPTSIENAYLFLKTFLFRLIENVGARIGARDSAEDVKAALLCTDRTDIKGAKTSGYAEKLRQIGVTYPSFVSQLALALSGRTVGITVNQVRNQKDIDVGKSMELIGERYFGFHTRHCGYLNYDEAAWKSLRNRRLLVFDFPHSILSKRFSELAKTILLHLGY